MELSPAKDEDTGIAQSKVWRLAHMFESLKRLLGPYKEDVGCRLRGGLARIEKKLIKRNLSMPFSPIFIIGVPRSGTTLLYQVLTNCLHLCYFNNLMAYFFESPALVSLLTSRMGGNRASSDFSSYYGTTVGWKSPSQGGYIWMKRWFPDDPCYIGSGFLDSKTRHEIRNTIGLIETTFGVPFVNKWPVNSVRVRAFAEVFPEAVFIRIRRDPVMTAQSILNGRRQFWKDERVWLSAKPSNYESIRSKPVIDQVCEQVFYVDKDMDADSNAVGLHRFLDLAYEELCASPADMVNAIKDFYSKAPLGCELASRSDVPREFKCDTTKLVSQSEYDYIRDYLAKLYEEEETKVT